jgi:hypothetical protein
VIFPGFVLYNLRRHFVQLFQVAHRIIGTAGARGGSSHLFH